MDKSKIKFVYFDCGGVLFRFKSGLQDIASKVGLSYAECEKIWLEMDDSICRGETDPQELWKRIKQVSGYTGKDIDFVPFWVDHFEPIPETHQLIRDLSKNYKTGLLTNIYPGIYELALQQGKIPNISYDQVIQSCEVGKIKPDPAVYKLAQQKAAVRPEEILFIDDSQKYLASATDLGWNTFKFDTENVSESVEKLGQKV
jgi:glucose-1-phosphatase